MATYPDIGVGDLVTADLLTSMQPQTFVKANTTSRNTTTTYADDPDLQNIPLGVGTWQVELSLFFTLTTTATQKIKTNWAFTGTWNNPVRFCIGPGSTNTAESDQATTMTVRGYAATGQDAVYDKAASGAFGAVIERSYNVVVTVAGNLSLQWAQSASSGNNTNVIAQSAFEIRQIG